MMAHTHKGKPSSTNKKIDIIIMKKHFINILRHLSLSIAAAVALTACIKDEPKKQGNEIENKLHEAPAKAVFTLTEAKHLPGHPFTYEHIDDIRLTESKQVITFAQKENAAFERTADSPESFVIKTQAQDRNVVYHLAVQYFNVKGELMNNQFVDNAQDKIHQHFFSMYKDNLIVRDKEQIPYVYLYADKNKAGEYMGEKNPIGLEGFFRFTRAIGTQEVSVDLRHFFNSKFGANGEVSPFYAAPRDASSQSDLDVSLKLKFSDGTTSTSTDEEDDSEGDDSNSNTPIVSTDQETHRFPGINTTEVRKIELGMYEGHIHAPASFHYVPGPKGFNHKSLGMEQEMTLEYRGDAWVVTSGTNFFLFNKGNMYSTDKYPAPVYGLWVKLYDGDGDLINEQFATTGAYQTFFRPKDIKNFSTGEASTVDANKVMGYVYRDTKPAHLSTKEGAKYVDATDPTGLKGFFYFNEENVRFALNMEIWQTPKGKKGSDGQLSTALAPSAHVQSTGKPVLSVSLPAHVWLSRSHTENFDEDSTLEDMPLSHQGMLRKLAELLKIDFEKIKSDMILRMDGERGSESGGRWF